MPVKRCLEKDLPGFKWGDAGKCYTYNPESEQAKNTARKKALEQGRAIEVGRAQENAGA